MYQREKDIFKEIKKKTKIEIGNQDKINEGRQINTR